MRTFFLTFLTLLIPLLLQAEIITGSCGDNLTYNLDTDAGVLTIEGTGQMTNYRDDRYVPWSTYKNNIQNINLLDGVTSISSYAFLGCTSLTSITLPNSVTSIGLYAFLRCESLTSISIPSSVTDIGAGAFLCCI